MRYLFILLTLCVLAPAQMLQLITNDVPHVAGGGNVTVSVICSQASSSLPESCSAVGTPTVGGKAVIIFDTFATASPTSGNITCSNNGTANTYTFRGGNTVANYISVVDATLTNVASGMTFTCTSTQTGVNFGGNLTVLLVTGWTTGIDAGPTFNTTASSSTSWASSTVTPTVIGDGLISAYTTTGAGAQNNLTNTTSGWTAGPKLDLGDSIDVGPSMTAYQSNYASTSAISTTYTCASGCTSDVGHIVILAYK